MQENPSPSKVALITGAARRIGAEIARTLHQAQMNVVVHYHHSASQAKALCAELNQLRANSAIAVAADLTEIEKGKQLIQQTIAAWGRLDLLVNNASRFYRTPLHEASLQAWDDLINSNIKAPFFLSQLAAPFLKQQHGNIINITDIHSLKPLRDHAIYCISKSGLHMLTKVLAKELAPDIRVNAVAPGAIMWPEGENALSDADKQKIINYTALDCGGHPRDIAAAVLYLATATYVTGQVIVVDGGRLLDHSFL